MPKAIDLTVKNGANVDKTFTLISPAAGDGGLAEFALKEGPISSVFPRFTSLATRNVARKSRNAKLKLVIPSSYTDTVSGLTNVGSRAEFHITAVVPDDFPENLKDDFVAFGLNLASTPPVKAAIRDALSMT